MPPLLVIPGTVDRETALLQQSFSKSFKYAVTGIPRQDAATSATVQLSIPEYVQEAMARWMSELKADPDIDTGDEDLECSALLLTPTTSSYAASQTSADAPKETLFSLPPELRIAICRFAVLENDAIEVKPGQPPPPQPALLSTCRQIREEALDVYFKENTFQFTVEEFDSARLFEWRGKSERHRKARLEVSVHDSHNWPNILKWAKASYESEMARKRDSRPVEQGDVIDHVLGVTRRLRKRGLSFGAIEEVLSEMRSALASQDALWEGRSDA